VSEAVAVLPPLRIPRSLLDPRLALPTPDAQGLVAVQLEQQDGTLRAIQPWPGVGPAAEDLPLAITPPLEPHAHLDKAFSAAAFPNAEGTMAGAFAANGREAAERSAAHVLERGERALEMAWRHGLRAVRTHIDSLGPAASPSWEALEQLRRRWAGRVELQLVALVPLSHWLTAKGAQLAQQVAASGAVLGGVLGPPFEAGPADAAALLALLRLAERFGCAIDLHIDEGVTQPGRGVRLVSRLMREHRIAVPLICSHAASMALLPDRACRRLAEAMAEVEIGVVALPPTNLWLLGRQPGRTPLLRAQAPIRQLQEAGVAVAIGADNVRDPWYPAGCFDPIELLRLSVLTSHVLPWERQGLAAFTTVPSRLLGQAWDGVLRPGGPADLVVLGAASWEALLAASPQRRVLRSGRWLPPPAAESPSPLLAPLRDAAPADPG
jgi:cytosine deaminase